VDAVAVVLDLMQPAAACRGLVHKACELRLDPLWRPRCRSYEGNCSTSGQLRKALRLMYAPSGSALLG
jgi:hypothetical protein